MINCVDVKGFKVSGVVENKIDINSPNVDKQRIEVVEDGRTRSFYSRIGAVQALFSENLVDVKCSLEPDTKLFDKKDPCYNFSSLLNKYANDVLFYTNVEIDGKITEKIISRRADKRLLREIVKGVISNQNSIDKFINMLNIDEWDKIDHVFACIMRSAIYEILYRHKTPKIVAISEYTRVTDWFFGHSKAKFINALLDKIVTKLKCPDDKTACYITPEDLKNFNAKG